MVPIAPSKTTTCCGSSSRSTSGLSGNGLLLRRGTAHCVVLRFRVVDDDRRRRLFGHQLEGLGKIHSQRFLRRQKLEHRSVIVQIGTRAVTPRVALTTIHADLVLYSAMRPFGYRFG